MNPSRTKFSSPAKHRLPDDIYVNLFPVRHEAVQIRIKGMSYTVFTAVRRMVSIFFACIPTQPQTSSSEDRYMAATFLAIECMKFSICSLLLTLGFLRLRCLIGLWGAL